jgi:hypothetical protein
LSVRSAGQLGDDVGELDGPLERSASGDDLVGEPDLVRLVGVDHPSGDDHLHGPAHPDDAGEVLGSAVGEPDVPPRARDAERRVLLGDADVGEARPLQTTGVRRSVIAAMTGL